MTIKNIYGPPGVAPPAAAKGAQKVKTARVDQAAPTDRVEFSSLLQQLGRPGEVSGTAATQRAQKVAELKAQVASGNYQPDLTRVAASLLQFLTEEK